MMFGKYKKSYINRNNLYIIFIGYPKQKKDCVIELINVLFFSK